MLCQIKIMGVGRYVVFSVHAILLFISIVLLSAAMVTPRWEEMQNEQSGDIHQHGLFQDCTYAEREDQIASWLCEFKEFQSDYGRSYGGGRPYSDNYGRGDRYRPEGQRRRNFLRHDEGDYWRLEVLIILSMSILTLMFALGFSCGACCVRALATVACICDAVGVILGLAAIIYFTRMFYEPFNRTTMEAGQTVREMENLGVSFYVGVCGLALGGIAFFVGILATVLSCMARAPDRYSEVATVEHTASGKPIKRYEVRDRNVRTDERLISRV